MGDFNEYIHEGEQLSRSRRLESSMRNFRMAIDDCALVDLSFEGHAFTWCNYRPSPNTTHVRLDRAFGNNAWKDLFPDCKVLHLPKGSLDHLPILISTNGFARQSFLPPVQSEPFRFEKMWRRHSECADLIVSNWSNFSGLPSSDCTVDKLNCMVDSPSLWNKNTFGHVGRNIRELQKEIDKANSMPLLDLDKLKNYEKELDELLARKIGNGEDTRVFEDPWIPNLPHQMILNQLPHYDPHLCVNKFISPNRQWIREDVAHIFPANVANLIYGITLGRISLDDSWFWRFNPTGHYSVKSGYKEYCREVLSATSRSDKSMQHPDVWRRVWKSKLPGKVKHFVWRMVKEIFLVCSRLTQKGLDVPPACPFCDLEDESTFHALLGCPALGDLWRRSGIPFVEELDEDIDLAEWFECALTQWNDDQLGLLSNLLQSLD
ncbi:hypothetical protein G2W53_017476 [Senna tora]|uniref:Reverse transcriptase zinc-binding domain-containing protein n=1 Tax=Senna tora TaxID=362788 RepID=A0A834WKJ3_9FABA|nr:hypothetical protein G2W53_017476 [Senna tora]